MASSNKTTNYRLNQWRLTDAPERADFVADNHTIESALHGGLAQADASLASLGTVDYLQKKRTLQNVADLLLLEQTEQDCRLEALEKAQEEAELGARLDGHVEDQGNPHRVKAVQARAVPAAWIGEPTREESYFAPGEPIKGLPTGIPWAAAALSPDGRTLAVATQSSGVKFFEIDNSTGILEHVPVSWNGAAGARSLVAWSPDGQYLVDCGSRNPQMAVYRMKGNRPVETVFTAKSNFGAADCQFSPDGRYLFVCHTQPIDGFRMYSIRDGVFTSIPIPDDMVGKGSYSADWYPDGSLLAINDVGASLSNTVVRIYAFDEGEFTLKNSIASISSAQQYINRVRFSPDGVCIALGSKIFGQYGSADPYLYVYAINKDLSLTPLEVPQNGLSVTSVSNMAWSPNSQYVALALVMRETQPVTRVFRRNGDQFQPIYLELDAAIGTTTSMLFDSTGEQLILVHQDGILVYDLHEPSTGIASLDTGGKVPLEQFSPKVVTVHNIAPILEKLGLL